MWASVGKLMLGKREGVQNVSRFPGQVVLQSQSPQEAAKLEQGRVGEDGACAGERGVWRYTCPKPDSSTETSCLGLINPSSLSSEIHSIIDFRVCGVCNATIMSQSLAALSFGEAWKMNLLVVRLSCLASEEH